MMLLLSSCSGAMRLWCQTWFAAVLTSLLLLLLLLVLSFLQPRCGSLWEYTIDCCADIFATAAAAVLVATLWLSVIMLYRVLC
jgi:hypothetical protein